MTLNTHVLCSSSTYQLNSNGDFFYPDQHIKIETTHLDPTQVAEQIIAAFAIARLPAA